MKYEFHVGDYVETKTNSFGYINSTDDDGPSWHCVHDTDGYRAGEEYYVAGIEGNELSRYYNRIGQYDFTKPEQSNEIDRMKEVEEENIWNERSGGWLYIQQCKINELVDAVNELRKANSNAE